MSVVEWLVATLFVAAGSGVQASAGIGITMVAGPVLVAIEPDLLPGPMLLLATGINVRNAVMDRTAIDRPVLGRALAGAPIGVLAGFVLLAALDDGSLAIAVSLFVIGAGVSHVLGRRPPDHPVADFLSGVGTAFSSVAAALPGPVFAVFHGQRPAPTVRSTLGSFMIAITAVAVGVLVAQSEFDARTLRLTAILLPGVILGFPVGAFLRPRIAGQRFGKVILALAVASAVIVLIRQLVA